MLLTTVKSFPVRLLNRHSILKSTFDYTIGLFIRSMCQRANRIVVYISSAADWSIDLTT